MSSLKSLKQIICITIALLIFSTSTKASITWTVWDPSKLTNHVTNKEEGRNLEINFQHRPNRPCNSPKIHTEDCSSLSNPKTITARNEVEEFFLLEFHMPTKLKQLSIDWPFSKDSPNKGSTLMALSTSVKLPALIPLELNTGVLGSNAITNPTRKVSTADKDPIINMQNTTTSTNLTSMPETKSVTSSYWLAGIYNHLYFKQKPANTRLSDNKIPLPTTFTLLGLGMLALGRQRFLAKKELNSATKK